MTAITRRRGTEFKRSQQWWVAVMVAIVVVANIWWCFAAFLPRLHININYLHYFYYYDPNRAKETMVTLSVLVLHFSPA